MRGVCLFGTITIARTNHIQRKKSVKKKSTPRGWGGRGGEVVRCTNAIPVRLRPRYKVIRYESKYSQSVFFFFSSFCHPPADGEK